MTVTVTVSVSVTVSGRCRSQSQSQTLLRSVGLGGAGERQADGAFGRIDWALLFINFLFACGVPQAGKTIC